MKKSHIWIMILCCLILIIALGTVFLFKVPLSSVLLYGLILLCPLSHLLMMKFMGQDHSSTEQRSGTSVLFKLYDRTNTGEAGHD